MSSVTLSKVKNHTLILHMMHQSDNIDMYSVAESEKNTSQLIEYRPTKSHKSTILGDL
jgi:hypothetical protein